MAGHKYTYRGYYTPNAPRTDGWSKTRNDSDHVCRPVIIDAEGRKRPIVSFSPVQSTESYVTRTEAVQFVHSTVASDTNYDPRFSRPNSWENYGVAEDEWRRPPSPVRDPPPTVVDSITEVRTEASRPKFDPLSASNWRRTTPTTDHYGNSGRYSDNNDRSNKEWQKHKVNTNRYENSDDYFRNYSNTMEPATATSDGWVRPSQATWGTQPEGILPRPKSDINTAMRYLEEAAKPYPEITDSQAFAKRYGNFKFSTRR